MSTPEQAFETPVISPEELIKKSNELEEEIKTASPDRKIAIIEELRKLDPEQYGRPEGTQTFASEDEQREPTKDSHL